MGCTTSHHTFFIALGVGTHTHIQTFADKAIPAASMCLVKKFAMEKCMQHYSAGYVVVTEDHTIEELTLMG